MACFLVPGAEAVIVTGVTKHLEKRATAGELSPVEAESKLDLVRKLTWLTNLLWGGVVLLAFEHLWHGEISPVFPFLTAAEDPAELHTALIEMSTVGVGMAVLVTVAWALGILAIRSIRAKGSTPVA
ncbi:MAG: hypothetical protein SPI77_07200 [Corynebacterium sp.]|nr:hypothetical protein [Corynebacterium sp.]